MSVQWHYYVDERSWVITLILDEVIRGGQIVSGNNKTNNFPAKSNYHHLCVGLFGHSMALTDYHLIKLT